MIYRVFSSKDTFLTNVKKNGTQQTGSNFGASNVLEVFKEAGVSGAIGFTATASIARALFEFDLSEIAALTASGVAPSTGSTYHLKLSDARHDDTLPTSYTVEILPVSRSWSEGAGVDSFTYFDKGVANWDKATSTVWWDTLGGDFISDNTASFDFDTGDEDVEVNVTSIVGAWLTGGIPNNGFCVKLTSAEESDWVDYWTKKFHGRNSRYADKRPVLEMRWDDSLKDDRSTLLFGVTSSLFLYNKRRGQLTNISALAEGPNVMDVAIADQSGNVIFNTSASYVGVTGHYSAAFVLPSSSNYTGSLFYDMWSASGVSYMTGTFVPHNDGAFTSNYRNEYVVSVMNLKSEYEVDEYVRFNLFVRTRAYNPPVVLTGSLVMRNTIIEKGYYRIDNATTNERVIPLGTGSVETTRLSYDGDGNYFKMYMKTLSPNETYKIILFFDVDGQMQKIDQNFKFKVV